MACELLYHQPEALMPYYVTFCRSVYRITRFLYNEDDVIDIFQPQGKFELRYLIGLRLKMTTGPALTIREKWNATNTKQAPFPNKRTLRISTAIFSQHQQVANNLG